MTDNDPALFARIRINLWIRRLWEKCVIDEQNLVCTCEEHFTDALMDVGVYQQSHRRQYATGNSCRSTRAAIQATIGGW